MKRSIQYMLIFVVLFLCSCKDDYLTERNTTQTLNTYMYVSPEWETANYPIIRTNTGNAKYTISDFPEWLILDSRTGRFTNDTAYITCSAIQQKDFMQTGIYNTFMIMDIEGVGSCKVPVGYVNEGNPSISCNLSTVEFGVNRNDQSSITLNNQSDGILIWQVVKSPKWITLSKNTGMMRSYSAEDINIKLEPNRIFLADTIGEIVISNNSRNSPQYIVKVYYNTGNPSFSCNIDQIDFGFTSDKKTITINNYGNGILGWTLAQCPEWLTVSPIKGTIAQSFFDENMITLTCNRTGLSTGEHNGTVIFTTNDKSKPTYSINVKCWAGEGNSQNTVSIEGIVVNTAHDRIANKIYILTQSPNRLLVYDTEKYSVTNTITMDLAPMCVALSDDGNKAIVGHSGNVSIIDLTSYHVTKSIAIDFTVYDAVIVNDGLCLLSANNGSYYSKWLYLDTGNTQILSGIRNLQGKVLFHKVAEQNIIVATSMRTSPSGINIIDCESMKLTKYYHEEISPFWLSADGGKIFCSQTNVYRTPINATGEISPIGIFQNHGNYFFDWIMWVDHCPATNSLWVLENPATWRDLPNDLAQYEATNYTFVKSYSYSDYYTTLNGVSDVYATSAQYVYANNSGSDVFVIKNVDKKYNANAWSLESINVK